MGTESTGLDGSRRKRWMQRGESTIATTGLLLSAIILCGMSAAGWWTASAQRRSSSEVRRDSIQRVAASLADMVAPLLAQGDVSTLRRMVAEAARQNDLELCRVLMPDGAVLAAERPAQISVAALPDEWPTTSVGAVAAPSAEDGVLELQRTAIVPGRGAIIVQVRGSTRGAGALWADTVAGMGLIGAASLVALLLVYRNLRGRLRAMSYIRDALLALEAGETESAALTVRAELGAEAAVWNDLIAERERFHDVLVTRRLLESSTARTDRQGNLTMMCDAMSQGLLLVDQDLNVTYSNGAAAFFLGVARSELMGACITPVLPSDELRKMVADVASGAVQRATSIEVPQGDGETNGVLRYSARPVRHDDAGSAMVVIDDVTQQHVVAESRQSFITHVTHELRTPLSNILLYVESAMDEGEGDPELKANALNVINQEARRLDRIVGDMLSVAEIEAGSYDVQRDDVSLSDLFTELRADYAASAQQKKIVLEFDLPPKLPTISADRDKVALAVHNLVGNAIKYTPEGGYVTLKVDVDDERLTIAVTDSGIGIAEGECERVFEKFYRAHDDRIAGITGSGLGLALAREVVRLHGGDITVESQINQGSTFTLALPIPRMAAAA